MNHEAQVLDHGPVSLVSNLESLVRVGLGLYFGSSPE